MLKIEVQAAEVNVKQGTSVKTGKPYSIREQDAWAYCYDQQGRPHPHPMRMRVTLEDNQQPYAPGIYTLAPESLYVDKFGQLAIRAKLRPAVAAAKAA